MELALRPQLYGALCLAERAALPGRPAAPEDPEIGRRRLERWRAQPPFGRDGWLARRLAQDGLDEEGLLALLGEPREALAARVPETPGWLRELDEAFRLAGPGYSLPLAPDVLKEAEARFLWLAAPLVEQAERRITEALAEIPAPAGRPLPFDPETVRPLLLSGLSDQLLWTVTRVCVLELNVARLEERIAGETPEERFDAFVAMLRTSGTAVEILERYPVLARQLSLRLRHWSDASVELLRRLAGDWEEIRAAFGPEGEPGPLVHVRAGAGDRHRGNRTVTLLTFASGWRLVYKPRPMRIAVHFQDLLAWMNGHGFEPAFRLLGVLDRGEYGWMELVRPAPCASRDEVRRFYRRTGGYLGLLYALDAGDFHHENLIASGEHPLLIDLESIIEPRPPRARRTGADSVADELLARSVLRIGLLPQRAYGAAGEGIDISALGMVPGQVSEGAIPYWEGRGTDAMHLSRRPMEMIASAHRPSLDGSLADVSDYVEDLAEGFSRAYRLLAERRGELLGDGGLLARMAGDEARVILRSTRTYGHLLQESFHPFLLRDALERDRHFDHLWQGAADSPLLESVLAAEREELLEGDIPLFSARLDSRDLLGPGGRVWPGYLERSGLETARDRLVALDEGDLARQLWFIRASVAAHEINVYGVEAGLPESQAAAAAAEADPGRLLEAALAVGARLEALALRSNGDATWIGMQSRKGRNFRLTPLGHDLYGGLPGVVVFLAYLAEVTGEERFGRLARAGFHTLLSQRETMRGLVTSVGGYEGWGGMLWTLAHLSRLWEEPGLLEEAEGILDLLPDMIGNDTSFDLMAGAAGCIPGLLALHRTEPSDRALELAAACGEHLLRHVLPMERGASWLPPDIRKIASGPLTGFGHGAAGYAWSLLELAAATGDSRFRRAALDAVEYERGHFVPELGTWRELRTIEKTNVGLLSEDSVYLIAWCHGAPGVGLSRLRALRHVDDPEMYREIDVALRSTLEKGFDRSHCLCHGDLGNAELFLEAAGRLPEGGRWRAEAGRAGARVLAGVAEGGWKSGLPRGVEVPGLMNGLAGMGYGLLRLALPERIPSVLLLDPPVAS
ncbi:MAG TPA: type 2 lanthipeptide synthetase LanM family protein [Thermoanaerobaculia bacterium]|nr:type 2 lanthipeptide synthetase LanM family protein [Thermoanaerobaculia bacterium]